MNTAVKPQGANVLETVDTVLKTPIEATVNTNPKTTHKIKPKTVHPIVTHACQVTAMTPLSTHTFLVELEAPVGTTLNYQAGQYLQLELDVNNDGKLHSLSYSITNSFDSNHPRRLQLFIQNSSKFSEAILKSLNQLCTTNAEAKVTLPMGHAYLQSDLNSSHLLIAAGSGISKIKCLTEEILKQQPDANVNIYWSNRKSDEFYLLDEFKSWEDQHSNLTFTPILEVTDDDWQGKSGYIYEVIETDFKNLQGAHAYLCGSPQMVYGTIDKLKATGLNENNCYSDVFEYAPRG